MINTKRYLATILMALLLVIVISPMANAQQPTYTLNGEDWFRTEFEFNNIFYPTKEEKEAAMREYDAKVGAAEAAKKAEKIEYGRMEQEVIQVKAEKERLQIEQVKKDLENKNNLYSASLISGLVGFSLASGMAMIISRRKKKI